MPPAPGSAAGGSLRLSPIPSRREGCLARSAASSGRILGPKLAFDQPLKWPATFSDQRPSENAKW
eukprot:10231504-Alexandrium_andersonii.AAC.1